MFGLIANEIESAQKEKFHWTYSINWCTWLLANLFLDIHTHTHAKFVAKCFRFQYFDLVFWAIVKTTIELIYSADDSVTVTTFCRETITLIVIRLTFFCHAQYTSTKVKASFIGKLTVQSLLETDFWILAECEHGNTSNFVDYEQELIYFKHAHLW